MAQLGQKAYRVLRGGLALTGAVALAQLYKEYKENKVQHEGEDWKATHIDSEPVSRWSFGSLPSAFILELDLDRNDIVEVASVNPWDALFNTGVQSLSLRKTVSGIVNAGEDARVKGFFVTGNAGLKGISQVQELHEAIKKFKSLKKDSAWSAYYSEDSGARSNGTLPLYFSSVFDKVIMQPCGLLHPMGLCVVVPFMRELLDRFQVEPIGLAREEYKDAASPFTEKEFSKPHKEALQALISSLNMQILSEVSTSRRISRKEVQEFVDSSPMTSNKALEHKVLDKLAYRDSALEGMKEGDLPRVSMKRYLQVIGKEKRSQRQEEVTSKANVAVITLSGPIVNGWSRGRPQAPNIASGWLVKVLQKLQKSPNIKAVVLRINSPGGSAVASDAIRRELVKTRESGRPVVACMGDVAASGGYYIATGADKITALPGTITGSIGVILFKLNFKGLLAENGVNVESIATGKNAMLFSMASGMTEENKVPLDNLLDELYDDFVSKVCRARGMNKETGLLVAKGRVWSGLDAFNNGLVDKLGGLETALELAAEKVGLDRSEIVPISYPPQPNPITQLANAISGKDLEGVQSLQGLLWLSSSTDSIEPCTFSSNVARLLANDMEISTLLSAQGVQMLSLDALCLQKWITGET